LSIGSQEFCGDPHPISSDNLKHKTYYLKYQFK